jgi:heat-inducible transcriptional repressor
VLEEKGYLRQPHTSAGRVPTDEGYRAYVREIGEFGGVSPSEAVALRRQVEGAFGDGRADEIHGQLAEVIGDVSSLLGLVLAPSFEQGVFEGLELVGLTRRRLLLVATIRRGPVKSLVIEVESTVSRRDMASIARLLNERLAGLTMDEIRSTVRKRMQSASVKNPQLLRVVVDEIEALATATGDDLHVAGTRNIFVQPEFRDSLEIAGLMDLVERKDDLAHLLSDRQGVVVTIGTENEPREMHLCSMVTASYAVGGGGGVLGVIGPTRMPYERLVALLNYAATRAPELVS